MVGVDQPEVMDQGIWSMWSVVRDWEGIRGSSGLTTGFGFEV